MTDERNTECCTQCGKTTSNNAAEPFDIQEWMFNEAKVVAHDEMGLATPEDLMWSKPCENVPERWQEFVFCVTRAGVKHGEKCLERFGLEGGCVDDSTTVRDDNTGEDVQVKGEVGYAIRSAVSEEVRRGIPPTHELLEHLFIGYVPGDTPKPVIHLAPGSVHALRELSSPRDVHKPVEWVDGCIQLHIYDRLWHPARPGWLEVHKGGLYHELVPIDGVLADWEWRKIWNGLLLAGLLLERQLAAAKLEEALRGGHAAHAAQILLRARASSESSAEPGRLRVIRLENGQSDRDPGVEEMQEYYEKKAWQVHERTKITWPITFGPARHSFNR